MVKQLFVLGCSGSGKSTISRCIEIFARDRGWFAYFINDYRILYQMFLNDKKHEKFRPEDYGGFDVLKEFVYDTALDQLREEALTLTQDAKENVLIIIEFSRCDYREALKHFDYSFVHDASFLFLDADIETCIQRVNERIVQPYSLDDHFVPEHVVKCFGQGKCKQYIEYELKQDYDLTDDKVQILDTRRSIEEVTNDVKQFVANLLQVLVSVDS